jgi:hypothetical protein
MTGLDLAAIALGVIASVASALLVVAIYELRIVRDSRDRWRHLAERQAESRPGSWERTVAGKASASDWRVN